MLLFCDNHGNFSPTKEEFIQAKHQQGAFIFRPSRDDTLCTESELGKQLHSSVRTSNLDASLKLLIQGADPNYFHDVSISIYLLTLYPLYLYLLFRKKVQHRYMLPLKLIKYYKRNY